MEIRIYLHHGTSDDFYLHPPDYKVRRADYASLFELPIITGHGIAGNIVAVGEAAKKWPAGDKICTSRDSAAHGLLPEKLKNKYYFYQTFMAERYLWQVCSSP